ncbi:MAG: hypothetical protein R3E02_05085 [Blastomonas sp.]
MSYKPHFSLSLALALAAVAGVGMALPDTAAHAAKKKEEKGPKFDLSKEYRAAYGEADKALKGGDLAAAKTAIDAALALAANDDEKFLSGQLYITLGSNAKDMAYQRKGVDLSIDSGKISPEDAPRMYYYSGNFAYNAGDFALARQRLEQSIALGYHENEIEGMLAAAYFKENMVAGGLAALEKGMEYRAANGQTAPENWYLSARDRALGTGDIALYRKWAMKWASAYPSERSWRDAVVSTRYKANFTQLENLELLRFMHAAKLMTELSDYQELAEEATKERLIGEIATTLQEGVDIGLIQPGSPLVSEYLEPAKKQVADDKSSLPAHPSEVGGSGSPSILMNFADVWLGYGDYAKAVEFYQAGLAKAGSDAGRGNIGIGTAKAMAGDHAGAVAAFDLVSDGNRGATASLWKTWIAQKTATMAAPAATEAAAPAA